MKRTAELDLAEDVALVTFTMYEALVFRAVGGHGFREFEGFPGFCDHAGAAGVALHRAFRNLDCDQWIDIVVDYAEGIVRYALAHGHPADGQSIARLARKARLKAIRDNLAYDREVRT